MNKKSMKNKTSSVSILLTICVFMMLTGCNSKVGKSENTEDSSGISEEVIENNSEKIETGWLFACTTTEGEPVAGVKIQACDDSVCRMVETDESGTAYFDAKDGTYDIHILKIPEGYEITGEDEFTISPENRSITLLFKQ